MTVPAQVPPRHFEGIEDVFALLRAEGNRVTMPCRIILEALFAAEGPISAPYIARTTALADSDLSSVYRNLDRLESLGVVSHAHLGHGPSLYMLVGSGEREFLVCERCNAVSSVDPTELDSVRGEIEKQFGFRAGFTHFPIVGLCTRCAAQGQPPP
jgi:Fur family ferric uptake transcriptional regulator